MVYFAIILAVLLGLFVGFYMRELKDTLHYVRTRVDALKMAQDKAEKPTTGFAEPMTKVELIAQMEEDKIRMLNS